MIQNQAKRAVATLPRSAYIRQALRAGGPGGQHQNKTETAIRLIHIATGLSATSRSEKSQHANFDIAMRLLMAKLAAAQREASDATQAANYAAKPEASFGSQLRSYVLDRDRRVVDRRSGIVERDTASVLAGGEALDGLLRAALLQRV